MMIKSLFRISVSLGLIGIVLGIVMGIRQDFVLMPAHAHLNLLGFVTMFLSALYYRVVPEAAASGLARYQAVVSVAGAVVFPIGIACVLLGGHDRFEPVVVAGALTVLLGMALFAVIVFRTCGQQRAMPAAAEARARALHFENNA
jgi:uncharacterized membrane protein